MIRKTLKDAVLDVAVRDYTLPPKPFSAYEITKTLRADVNAKRYEIAEFVGIISTHGQEITHSQVRDLVVDLHNSGYFDRTHNGTFFEYSIGNFKTASRPLTGLVPSVSTAATIWVPSADKDFVKLTKILCDYCNITATVITPSTNVSVFGLDDLDWVELAMIVEEEWNITEIEFDFPPYNTVLDIYNTIKKALKPVTPVAVIPSAPKVERLETVLDAYIKRRFKEHVNPTLTNAQKAVKRPGTSLRFLSDTAKMLGYNVIGDQSKPFGDWQISR